MSQDHRSNISIEAELSRDFGLPTALAIGIGTMIAAGIFTLSGLAVRNVGSAAIVSFLLAGIVAAFTALIFCEFVSMYPYSGGGYLYARKTFSPPLAYFAGWTFFLGYASSCAFYIASISSYFYEFIWQTPLRDFAGVVTLLTLILINIKGTKESGVFQIIVTLAKIVLLLWFVYGGMGSVNTGDLIEKFSTDITEIGSTAALVFITFFGYSAIAASGGEMKNPVRNVPRAILYSMGFVTVLYVLVILVVISAGLTDYTEAAMGETAVKFLGPVGGMVIVAGALFSMISASNASILAGSRIALSMSRLGHLPSGFGSVNRRTGTPIIALLLIGGAILLFSISFPLENIAHFADTILLVALIFVNVAFIVHRRRYPNIERPFRIPFGPVVASLAIITNSYLLFQIILHQPLSIGWALLWLLLGLFAFIAWKGIQPMEVEVPGAPSWVALEQSARNEGRYRILVPIANPANVEHLFDLAAAVAKERNGEIIALRVAVVPDQIGPTRDNYYVERERQVLELAHENAQKHGVPVTSLVRIGHNAARAILETARERKCNLIILGWKGYTSTAQKILGEVVDSVVNHARTDIILLKQAQLFSLNRILLPTAGGEHAQCAEQYAAAILYMSGGSVTVCSVVPPDADEETVRGAEERLQQAVIRLTKYGRFVVTSKLIRDKSVNVGIIKEAEQYDTVIVGAAGQSIYSNVLFGSIPELVAKHCGRPVILVKHYHPVKAILGKVLKD